MQSLFTSRNRSDLVTFCDRVGITIPKNYSRNTIIDTINADLFNTVFVKPYHSDSILLRETLEYKTCSDLIVMGKQLGFLHLSKLRKNQLIELIHNHYHPKNNHGNKFKTLLMQRDLFSQHVGCFLYEPVYELLINGRYNMNKMVNNPHALSIIINNTPLITNIGWNHLSSNPNALQFVLKNCQHLSMEELVSNPTAFPLVEKIIDLLCTHITNWISYNPSPSAIAYLSNHQELIDWKRLSANPSAISLLSAYPENIDWEQLSANPSAIDILQAHPDKINWRMLSYNPHPIAIEMLTANPHKIDWQLLSANPFAIPLLIANPHKINFMLLSQNPSILVLSHDKTKTQYYENYDKLLSSIFTHTF
jgi:hypothetical protein